MPLNLPLPKVIPDAEPGGGILSSMRSSNALSRESLENKLLELRNQYYAPEVEAAIANQNALTNKYNTMMPLEAEALKQQNQMFIPQSQANISHLNALTRSENIANQFNPEMMRLANQHQAQMNQFYPQQAMANIAAQKALSDYREMGGFGMSVGGKEIMGLVKQIQKDNPGISPQQANQIASAALLGQSTLADGSKIPTLSGIAQEQIAQIQKRSSTSAIQNQAANMDVLSNDINKIDVTPLTKFAGLKGRSDFAKYSADMALGNPVPQEFRDYLAFKDVVKYFIQDSLRKGFNTSVMPTYVQMTLGKASDPNSTWWHDPQQVLKEWKTTKDFINDAAKQYKTKATFGAAANISDKNSNKFTPENIAHTAKKYGITEAEVKRKLGIE